MHSDKVRELVKRYCNRYGMVECIIHDLATPAEIWRERNDANGHGCYALYDKQRRLRYIGSSYKIRKRVCEHFMPNVQSGKFWDGNGAVYVQLIETAQPWEHWSLEAYLTLMTEDMRRESEMQTNT